MCKKFSKTPGLPVVCLLVASESNQVLTMDLKEVQIKKLKYILHMIDTYTKMIIRVFTRDKNLQTIVHNIMNN